MVMVWPCTLPVDAYAAAGREVEFPRLPCPGCAGPLVFWSGYRRWLRAAEGCASPIRPDKEAVTGEPTWERSARTTSHARRTGTDRQAGRLADGSGHSRALAAQVPASTSDLIGAVAAPPIFRAGAGGDP